MNKFTTSIAMLLCFIAGVSGQSPRQVISLNDDWWSIIDKHDSSAFDGFQDLTFTPDKKWVNVSVPHNWDVYGGYRRLLRGNLFGYAGYRRLFEIKQTKKGKRFYLFFEGVGSYATVWLNGKLVGKHAGGRTTFTLDVTDAILTDGSRNILAVRADHPEVIKDLPWVDGGGSTERGISEGSQPLGIFRPVSLFVKNEVNITPFGVHYWNDETANQDGAEINQTVEVSNSSQRVRKITVVTKMLDTNGKKVAETSDDYEVGANVKREFRLSSVKVSNPNLWGTENPYLYTMETTVREGQQILDRLETAYGIRSIRWPKGLKPIDRNQLLVNGKPVFIHGIAEYEHKIGGSHSFSQDEIDARVRDIKALGFNSFRDAHQPHHLRYQEFWDRNGILLWTQMAAHIWFDNEAFRNKF